MKLNNNDDSHNSGLNLLIYNMLLDIESHPAWVCGLKQDRFTMLQPLNRHTLRGCVDWNNWLPMLPKKKQSHTLRGCVDWNMTIILIIQRTICHTLRGCVDWNINYSLLFAVLLVTPCVGVWIETFLIMIRLKSLMSHPAWVCGLKPQLVTTRPRKDVSHPAWVCGLKLIGRGANDATTSSHPAWVCGLKHPFRELLNGGTSHTLRGCVDWNPFKTTSPIAISCHTLRGCVDWNNREIAIRCDRRRVTPCVGVWIETNVQAAPVGPLIVTPCVGVWIETSNSVQTGWPISSHPAWVYMDWSIVHSLVKFMEEL